MLFTPMISFKVRMHGKNMHTRQSCTPNFVTSISCRTGSWLAHEQTPCHTIKVTSRFRPAGIAHTLDPTNHHPDVRFPDRPGFSINVSSLVASMATNSDFSKHLLQSRDMSARRFLSSATDKLSKNSLRKSITHAWMGGGWSVCMCAWEFCWKDIPLQVGRCRCGGTGAGEEGEQVRV